MAKKIFDTNKMVHEIRHAIYHERHNPEFDPAELKRIKAKWTKLLEEELKAKKKAA